jgi:hypothetical protein
MTQVFYPSTQPTGQATEPAALEDLIPEARQHHRRRLLRIATVALAVVALIAGLLIWTVGGGEQGRPLHVSARSPHFGATVAAATARAGSAIVRVVYRSSDTTKIGHLLTSQPCPTGGTTANGKIDFISHSLALTVISRRCSGSSTTEWVMEQRQVKGTLLATLPRVSGGFPLPFPATPPGQPWLTGASARLATGSMGQVAGMSSSLTAGFLPTVLLAIHEPVTKIGTRVIEGTIVTGYRTAITLADLQRSSRTESRLSGASFENIGSSARSLPAATTIPIQLAIWIDAMGRVRQLVVTQPFYFLRYADGSGPGGPQIYPSEYLGRQGLTGPYKTHDVVVSVSLSEFGTPSATSPPPPNQIDSSYSPNV